MKYNSIKLKDCCDASWLHDSWNAIYLWCTLNDNTVSSNLLAPCKNKSLECDLSWSTGVSRQWFVPIQYMHWVLLQTKGKHSGSGRFQISRCFLEQAGHTVIERSWQGETSSRVLRPILTSSSKPGPPHTLVQWNISAGNLFWLCLITSVSPVNGNVSAIANQ